MRSVNCLYHWSCWHWQLHSVLRLRNICVISVFSMVPLSSRSFMLSKTSMLLNYLTLRVRLFAVFSLENKRPLSVFFTHNGSLQKWPDQRVYGRPLSVLWICIVYMIQPTFLICTRVLHYLDVWCGIVDQNIVWSACNVFFHIHIHDILSSEKRSGCK